ncbi:MAG: ATP-dependent DNA helicase RecG [Spirochaetia bacterium]|nr:ATP-dependent DNA helicase RecG [Spirochaetia bacterium]
MESLSNISVFNEEQLKALYKKGIKDVQDLLYYFPRKYVDRSQLLDLKTSRVGDVVTFIGIVSGNEVKYGKKRRLIVTCLTQDVKIELIFFQAIPYYQKLLKPDIHAAFSGKIDMFHGSINILHPEVEILSGDELMHMGKIIPIYRITDGMRNNFLTNRIIRSAVRKTLDLYSSRIVDYLLPHDLIKNNLMTLDAALENIHFPKEMQDVENSRRRLAFDELLIFAVIMYEKKIKRRSLKKSQPLNITKKKEWASIIQQNLPFKLTFDQEKAISTLHELAYKPYPFGALLQGDVGSGKTLVALLCALEYLEEGIQVAVMAPTEILARQHYLNFINYISDLPFLQMDLLTGSEKASEKKAKLDRIKRGDTLFIIGTHALIQEKTEFASLGLVIIDEQHRFGVEQRDTLRGKGIMPDLLAMSATPIPRSLTLTLYGDLESIILSEKPPGRMPIDTRLFNEEDLPNLYRGIKKYVDMGRQAYIVYPLIEESEKITWASVMTDYHYLEQEIFQGYRLGLLHGKLSSEEKDRAMEKFKQGVIQILVTTTVVEVGVDVPNATVMMIRNAEKFGLSQLHQLRGRVGRGQHQSFCIMVKSDRITSEGEERLKSMVESEDGFYLAQKDFEIRGSGELLNTRQSGISEFKIADLRYHSELAVMAHNMVEDKIELRQKIMSMKNWKSLIKKGFILFDN